MPGIAGSGVFGDVETILGTHLAEDVVLESSFVGTPFVGKGTVLKVLGTLLSDVDEFETTAVIAEKQRAAVMLRVRVGDVEVTGGRHCGGRQRSRRSDVGAVASAGEDRRN